MKLERHPNLEQFDLPEGGEAAVIKAKCVHVSILDYSKRLDARWPSGGTVGPRTKLRPSVGREHDQRLTHLPLKAIPAPHDASTISVTADDDRT